MRLKVSNVCQLLDKSKYPATHTQLGCTFTNNGDGSFTINGTIQNGGSWSNPLQQITQNLYGHKLLLLTNSTSDIIRGEMKFTLQDGSSRWGTYNSIYTVEHDNYKYIAIRIYMDNNDAGKTIDNATVKFQLFDLTEMYGAGNEPTTVAQFRQDFPNEMYEYSPVCWKKFSRLKYVTETKNLFNISNADIISKDYYFTLNQGEGSNFYVMTVKSGATYTVSYERFIKSDDTYAPSALELSIQTGNRYKDGTQLFLTLGSGERGVWVKRSRHFTVPSGITQVTFSGLRNRFLYRNFMVQEGSTPTPYQPYGYLPLNRGKYIANKEPVQLLDKSKYPATNTGSGVTFTNNGDGSFTVNGTSTSPYYSRAQILVDVSLLKPGHKIVVTDVKSPMNVAELFVADYTGGYIAANKDSIYTVPQHEGYRGFRYEIRVYKDETATNAVIIPQFFDLTEMYGAGNEPTTVAQFRADFPNELYDYNPYNAITFR